jgi:3-dehydroquinate synthase
VSAISAPGGQQPIFTAGGLRRELTRALLRLRPAPTRVFLVLDPAVVRIARAPAAGAVRAAGLSCVVMTAPGGEARKNLSSAGQLTRALVRAGADRRSLVIAIGGGVTSDLTGFAASITLRGLRWAVCPTTLLAMADAALGGKTAVNLPEGKNLAGAFHFPSFVIADTRLLRTLPQREWSCGLGEVVKSAMLDGEAALRRLERTRPADLRRASPALLAAARAAAALKLRVVRADPFEGGERALLNLGHTFGHALETAAGPRRLAHGEAVALGIRCALSVSARGGLASPEYERRIHALFERCGLPARFPGRLPGAARLAALLARDKKAVARRLDLVLPVAPGRNVIVAGAAPADVAEEMIRALGGLAARR